MAKHPRQSQLETGSGSESSRSPSPSTRSGGSEGRALPQQATLLDMELNENTDPRILLQAIRMQQGKANEISSQLQQARRELADRENQDIPSSHRRSRQKKHRKRRRIQPSSDAENNGPVDDDSEDDADDPASTNPDDNELMQAGRRAFVTHIPWVSPQLLAQEPDPHYDAYMRFESDKNREEGLRQDALACIPSHFRNIMYRRPDLRSLFRKGVNTIRSNTRTRLRNVITPAVIALIKDHVDGDISSTTLHKESERYVHLRHLIGYNEEEKTYDNWDVAVLHGNWAGSFTVDQAFLNRLPMMIFIAIIRGPTAARAFAEPEANLPVQTNDSQDKILALEAVTPGSIATCSMLARWLLSSDEKLQPIGSSTKLDYMAVYNDYLEKLVNGLTRRYASILNVFRVWNREVFPHAAATRAGASDQAAAEDKSRHVAELFAAEREGSTEAQGQARDAEQGSHNGDGGGTQEDGPMARGNPE